MKRRREGSLRAAILVAALGGWGGTLQAHDAWIELDGPAHVIRYGHDADGDPYDPGKIKQVLAFDAQGEPLPVELTHDERGAEAVTGEGVALMTLDFDNGYWSKVDGRSRNESKTATGAAEGSRSLKYGKTILVWGEQVTRPLGQRLELVPMSDKAPASGDALMVAVRYDGQPLPGAKVHLGGHDADKPVSADAQGRATVPLPQAAGVQSIGVSHSVPFDGPEADKTNLSANLRFELR